MRAPYNGWMTAREILERVTVVLVRARNPNNIGAAARAMHDFGFTRLRVVNEFAVPFEAAKSAVDASAVLERAARCASVAEAVADCTLVVGTTAVGERALRHPLLPLKDAAGRMLEELQRPEGQVALLFGSEKTGLSNEELSFCDLLLTIPMYEHEGVRHPSMNLGQAVAVCLYELVRGAGAEGMQARGEAAEEVAADSAELERVGAVLGEMLEATGYARRHPAHAGEEDLRRRVRRMGLDRNGAQVWMGIFRQVLWKVGQKDSSAGGERE